MLQELVEPLGLAGSLEMNLEGCVHVCFQRVFSASGCDRPMRSHPTTDQRLLSRSFSTTMS